MIEIIVGALIAITSILWFLDWIFSGTVNPIYKEGIEPEQVDETEIPS